MAVVGQAAGRWIQKFPMSTLPLGSHKNESTNNLPSVDLYCTSQSYENA